MKYYIILFKTYGEWRKWLTPWPVRASISVSISGQCWGHSLFIISTMILDRTSLMWLSSSRIEWVPWWEQNWHHYNIITVCDNARTMYIKIWDSHTLEMLVPYIHLIKAAWHTPLNWLSPPVACRSIWTCKKQRCFLATLLSWTCNSLICVICGALRATHLITCSRICNPKCLTTAGWALSANCKPHGTQSVLLSLNSSQNWWKIELGSVHWV